MQAASPFHVPLNGALYVMIQKPTNCPNCKSKIVSNAKNTVERGKEYVCPVCNTQVESANKGFLGFLVGAGVIGLLIFIFQHISGIV